MKVLIDRLTAANPGWPEWSELLTLVDSLKFKKINDKYMGIFYASNRRLVFSEPSAKKSWPEWLPKYVPALCGMKADSWEMAGGYADIFSNKLAVKGALFSPAGTDEQFGLPLIEVPPNVYTFQSNSSGAQFFVSTELNVLCPNSDDCCFETLDTLEEFTKKNIRQALAGKLWFEAYADLKGTLLD